VADLVRREVVGVPGVPDYRVTELAPVRRRVALVIPVLNEDGRISDQLRRISHAAPEVDVVLADGGSTDGSTDPERLAALGVATLLTKTGPGRLSAQLRMAFHHCIESGYDGVVTMDGNGKDGVEGIPRIVDALDAGAGFVQGSRFVRGGVAENTPWTRYLAIRAIHAPVTSAGARTWYTDTTNGFRGHSRALLVDPRVDIRRDVFDTYELLAYLPVRAARLGYTVREVPVSRRYPDSGPTPTKIHGAGAHSRMMRILLNAATGRYDPRP
jgi:dolichol-phosphate mannosyltransferase